MRLGSRQFSPRLWAVLLYLGMVTCMLWLGFWQLDRAALKVSLQQAADESSKAQASVFSQVEDPVAASQFYQRVLLQGRYDGERQFLWDNRIYQGQAGFEVIVPFQLEDGRWLLVNRGWIAPGPSRSELPEVSLSNSASELSVTIEGFLSSPSKGFASGEAVPGQGSWPRLLQYFDYDAISRALDAPVIATVVQAQILSTDGLDVRVPTPRPEWLIANWQPAASGPAKHYSYAFQWFAMAIALTILFIFVNTRKIPAVDPEKSEHP
ncbi:SURF1 family protein [Granulosicoccus antarcticus]|uniref:SURF1-like protein n=1 Tax=Granulosicoccus antarcticus IMCC3135 TaxID=1192854 RepID=A0A2Z2NVH3_9GAMM|nr:SURF1 family protein [Granulosicoccus antarcticus]ASJ71154.1 hypothetical protein IMCC3135_05205 [Granulosicoccus antarcticus IMCC3135]